MFISVTYNSSFHVLQAVVQLNVQFVRQSTAGRVNKCVFNVKDVPPVNIFHPHLVLISRVLLEPEAQRDVRERKEPKSVPQFLLKPFHSGF